MNHFYYREIYNYGKKTKALWSYAPKGTLVVFLHGFRGDSLGTWYDFPFLIQDSKLFKGIDVVFYGYDSEHRSVNISADEFGKFVNEITSIPSQVFTQSFNMPIFRDLNFRYKKIIIVAHSLGAIICRRAMLEAYNIKQNWINYTGMLLFAPAHSGARRLLYMNLSIIDIILFPIRYFTITSDELVYNSPIIEALIKDTEKVIALGKGFFTIAKVVIWAELERVVYNTKFCNDPKAEIYNNKTHTEVCKPNNNFLQPFNEIIKLL